MNIYFYILTWDKIFYIFWAGLVVFCQTIFLESQIKNFQYTPSLNFRHFRSKSWCFIMQQCNHTLTKDMSKKRRFNKFHLFSTERQEKTSVRQSWLNQIFGFTCFLTIYPLKKDTRLGNRIAITELITFRFGRSPQTNPSNTQRLES